MFVQVSQCFNCCSCGGNVNRLGFPSSSSSSSSFFFLFLLPLLGIFDCASGCAFLPVSMAADVPVHNFLFPHNSFVFLYETPSEIFKSLPLPPPPAGCRIQNTFGILQDSRRCSRVSTMRILSPSDQFRSGSGLFPAYFRPISGLFPAGNETEME